MLIAPISTLIRWLGPWAREAPRCSIRSEIELGGTRPVRAYVYRPRRPRAAYLISPGLHPHGPADPRMDRLARILAEAGFLVLAPFLPDHLGIRASATAVNDLMTAFDGLEAIARDAQLPAPSVFSVSFGSDPAFRLCGDPRYAHRVRGLFVFGGFADFTRVCRFSTLGEWEHAGKLVRLPFDPTNPPGVFINIVEYLGVTDAERQLLTRAWHTMCLETWNRVELKHVERLRPIARTLADEHLPRHLHDLFLQGCGVAPGTRELLLPALQRAIPDRPFLDPRPYLAHIQAPIVLAHGRGDAVVCFHEAEQLRAMLPRAHPYRVYVTGMFSHGTAKVPSPRMIASELQKLFAMTRAIAALPLGAL